MEADEAIPKPKLETTEKDEPQEVAINLARTPYGATMTFIRKSDAQLLGHITFDVTAQEHIQTLGKLFAAFAESHPVGNRIQMPRPAVAIPTDLGPKLNGAGR